MANARRFYGRIASQDSRAQAPRMSKLAAGLDYHDDLVRMARETFDAAGELRDGASPDLGRLRRERDMAASRVRGEAERLLQSEEYAPFLQDQFVTLREDRFVLPLRASFKSMGLGIVHDTSRTGETVFVEPTALVELNNRLKVAEIEIRRESRRILEELAGVVSQARPGAAPGPRDSLAARRLGCRGPLVSALRRRAGRDRRRIRSSICSRCATRCSPCARSESRSKVTPNDVALGLVARRSKAKALVVSGPNAGGKTVLLKSVGLAALAGARGFARAGGVGQPCGLLSIECWPTSATSSRCMGDLSTFSAHLANLVGHSRCARQPRSDENLLILCDELMVGTHPDQGAALARAMLEALGEAPGLIW